MLKTRLLVTVILLALPAVAAAVNWQQPKLVSNVWKISKAGQPDSYLLGTIHVGREQAALSQEGKNLLARTDKLITEVDMHPTTAEELRLAGVMIFKIRATRPLRQLLGQDDFARLQKLFARHTETRELAASLDGFKPWAAVLLSSSILPKGYSNQTGVDILLVKQAVAGGKRRGSLEKMDDVLDVFAKLPDDLALSVLRSGLHCGEDADKYTRRLHSAYQAGHYTELSAQMEKSMHTKCINTKDEAALTKWMVGDVLIARNRAWLPKIKAESAKQPTLFAVGIAHLMTEHGLIVQLRKEGYRVTPVQKKLMW
ncbi:MAG: TraB/GumN family protein [Neisseria sp.]|nr:TraB/GumN family protein [Neisseria sp.]